MNCKSNSPQVWLDPGTQAIFGGLPPHSNLFFSVSLLGSIILSCFRKLHTCGINIALTVPRLHSDSPKRETLPHSFDQKKRVRVIPPEKHILLIARVTGILIDTSIQAPGIRAEFPRDRVKGKRKCVGQTNSVLTNTSCLREAEISPVREERDAHPKNKSANKWLLSFFNGKSCFPLLLLRSQWLWGLIYHHNLQPQHLSGQSWLHALDFAVSTSWMPTSYHLTKS